jgi:subtilase family serine protease
MPMPSPTPDTALPDLTGAIKVNGQEPDGKDDCKSGKNTVTVVVKNGGTADAGSIVVRLTVGGLNEKPEQTVKGLAAGQEREVRFENVRLKKGEHLISASLDAKGEVAESNEDNNEPKATARCKDGD